MVDKPHDTDESAPARLIADGNGEGDNGSEEEKEEENGDEEETERTDVPPSPPRDSKEGQTQAPERDEEDLIDRRTPADTDRNDENEDTDEDEDEDKNENGKR